MVSITMKTGVSIALLVVVCAGVAALSGFMWSTSNKLSHVSRDIQELRKDMRVSWSISHQQMWVDQMARRNPSLDLPSAFEVARIMFIASEDKNSYDVYSQ